MRKSCPHLFLGTAHSPPTPATVHSLELDSWNENCGGPTLILQFWLNPSFPKKILLPLVSPKKILLPLVSPMFGKVAPPVDHHPTHLAISGAGKSKREVEQGQLVTVAHTLASGKWFISI